MSRLTPESESRLGPRPSEEWHGRGHLMEREEYRGRSSWGLLIGSIFCSSKMSAISSVLQPSTSAKTCGWCCILEPGPRHPMMRLIDRGICIEARIVHDAIDEIIDHGHDGVHSAESFE